MISRNKLQEIVQEEYRSLPTYIFAKDGPDHAPQFRAFVSFCGLTFQSPGPSRTMREAENAAADVALDALLAKPDDDPMQTNEPVVAIQIQSGEIHSNLQKEANKEETLQPPGSLPSTSESGITNLLATSGQIGETAQVPEARPQSFPSSSVHFASPRELSTSENSGRGKNKQNIGNIYSVSHNSGNEKDKEQGNNIATGILGKRQRTEDLQQPEERTSIPQFCPGMHKSQLHNFAMSSGFHFPAYSSIYDGLPHRPRFKATVKFDGQTFESPGFFNTRRQAEHAAALAALDSFSERVSTLVESPICKILLEIKAQKEGSPLPVYNTTLSKVSRSPVFTSKVKFNGMEFEGKAANNKKQAENNAATVAWSALKEFKGSAVETQVHNDKGKAPVCESDDHPLIQAINHLKEETTRAGSNVSVHNLPTPKRLAFQEQVNKLTIEMERLQELITSISNGSCTFRGIPQNTDQARVQQQENVQNVVVDNDSRWGIPAVGDLPTNGWASCGNFDNGVQHPTGSQANTKTKHSSVQACNNRSRGRHQFRGRCRGRTGGRFGGRSSWASPPTNDEQVPAFLQGMSSNQRSVQQERNAQNGAPNVGSWWWDAQNGAPNVGSGWDVAGIDDPHPPTTGWDGWGNPEDIHQPLVGSQTTFSRDHSSAQARRSRPRFPGRSTGRGRSGRCGRSPPSTRHTEWTPPTRNDKHFPRLELAISPVRARVQEENVQTEEVDDGLEWNLPDSSDPPAFGSGGWNNNFDDKDPPPASGIVAPCA